MIGYNSFSYLELTLFTKKFSCLLDLFGCFSIYYVKHFFEKIISKANGSECLDFD